MPKYLYFSIATLLLPLFLVNDIFRKEKKEVNEKVTVTCEVTNCERTDSLFLFEFNGINFKKKGSTPVAEGVATFEMPQSAPRFYYVGLAANNARPIIIGNEDVGMESSCKGFRSATIKSSNINKDYEALKKRMTGFSNELRGLNVELREKMGSEAGMKEMHGKYVELDKRQRAEFDQLKKEKPYLSKVFALNSYLSFQVNGKKYSDELQYFAYEYFQLVDWNDKDLEYMPWVYEGLKNYTKTLSSVNMGVAPHRKFIEYNLNKIPYDSRTYQLALSGVIASLEEKKHQNYKYFADQFIKKYASTLPDEVAQMKQKLGGMAGMVAGGSAPDFEMNQPDGTPLKLSDFKGKVTLIDFWASWCGPCRRENPYVVKLYNKYKDRGFDVLGVSLDGNKDRWLKAIEADGLAWNHVSDLKKWGNTAAKLYGVRSIPHTVLLDREGKIIARGMRSGQLEQALVQIFGE